MKYAGHAAFSLRKARGNAEMPWRGQDVVDAQRNAVALAGTHGGPIAGKINTVLSTLLCGWVCVVLSSSSEARACSPISNHLNDYSTMPRWASIDFPQVTETREWGKKKIGPKGPKISENGPKGPGNRKYACPEGQNSEKNDLENWCFYLLLCFFKPVHRVVCLLFLLFNPMILLKINPTKT